MKKIKIFLMLISAAFVVSCESTTYDQISIPSTNPTYTINVGPVIKANCSGCHSGGSQFPNLENYAQVKEATQNGNLLCKINGTCGSVMPTNGKMSQGTIDMIQLWSSNGYIN